MSASLPVTQYCFRAVVLKPNARRAVHVGVVQVGVGAVQVGVGAVHVRVGVVQVGVVQCTGWRPNRGVEPIHLARGGSQLSTPVVSTARCSFSTFTHTFFKTISATRKKEMEVLRLHYVNVERSREKVFPSVTKIILVLKSFIFPH